ncbi:putative nuclease HARBI1 [Rhagoletis pomonella]|uniref:putative nuclease HARBI1 n=1 Tax=Rhagoletis pomonella TaxID=28610 RepID=UPI001786B04A|nr:putative nuclease HARBI1 [Rhagoletis pomonella]
MDSIAFYFNNDEDESSSASVRRSVRDRAPNIFKLTDIEFIKQFRVNKNAYKHISSIICGKIPPVIKSTAISRQQKLSLCLRILAEGSYQNAVGKDYMLGMAQPTVSKIFSEVIDILENELCDKWLNLKMNDEEQMESRSYFYNKSKIPGIVMCIDGTHIRIAKPTGSNSHLFYNRKGFYSLNVLVICDHKQRIRYVNAKYPGSAHDSFVWSNSDVSQYFQAQYEGGNRNLRLLGDAGYGLAPWLITPFRNPAPNTPSSRFNKWHSSGRNIIERTIGVWKKLV